MSTSAFMNLISIWRRISLSDRNNIISEAESVIPESNSMLSVTVKVLLSSP